MRKKNKEEATIDSTRHPQKRLQLGAYFFASQIFELVNEPASWHRLRVKNSPFSYHSEHTNKHGKDGMNNELKDLNKKIRFLNEVIQLHELFKPKHKQNIASTLYQERELELAMSRHRVKLPLTTNKIDFFNQFRFFGDKTEAIKRTVKDDELISVFIVEEGTKAKFPFSIQVFKQMTNKIIFI